jgi:hypothetical protein
VTGAFSDELVLSGRALEILSVVSGALLTGVQRRSLLPALQELLSDPSFAPLGSGPLSQADVLGACLGLAFFAVHSGPRSWSFAHIPATRNKTPDIFAVADDGSVWLVELKALSVGDRCGTSARPAA